MLGRGSLVALSGLRKSEAKLNGRLGIILSNESVFRNGIRYPVVVFAHKKVLRKGKLKLCEQMKREIKVENLTEESNPREFALFENAICDLIENAKDRDDCEDSLFWLEVYYKYWPDNYSFAILYASGLRSVKMKYKESLSIMQELKATVPESHEQYGEFCFDFCRACCEFEADDYLKRGLEMALKIPTCSDAGKDLFAEALDMLTGTCNKLLQEGRTDPELTSISIRCSEIASNQEPDDPTGLINLGAAYCLSGDNVGGAQCYNRALAEGALDPADRIRTIHNLIIAQLQCPGMPLSNCNIILCQEGKTLVCIKKEDRAKIRLEWLDDNEPMRETTLSVEVTQPGTKLNDFLFEYAMPSDPDDPDVFPPELLEMLEEEPLW